MGEASGRNFKRCAPGCKCGRHQSNAGSFDKNRRNLDAGEKTRYPLKYPPPSVGDRFGELTVVGYKYGPAGGLRYITTQCSCGGPPTEVQPSNLRKGASTRCPTCARKAAAASRNKLYYGYKDVVPDAEHRRRLLNRIAACHGRCFNPKDRGYPNYGGRGVTVFWGRDRRAFLEYLVGLPGWDDPDLELDRIDVDGNYAPGNLRFVTRAENTKNKRSAKRMSYRILDLEAEIRRLRARIRHLERGAEASLHGVFE